MLRDGLLIAESENLDWVDANFGDCRLATVIGEDGTVSRSRTPCPCFGQDHFPALSQELSCGTPVL